jgi:hypothetical protein
MNPERHAGVGPNGVFTVPSRVVLAAPPGTPISALRRHAVWRVRNTEMKRPGRCDVQK